MSSWRRRTASPAAAVLRRLVTPRNSSGAGGDGRVDFTRFVVARWRRHQDGGRLEPVVHPHLPDPSVLVGMEEILELLHRNTRAFLEGKPCHDVLIWGERGGGKSTLVKSLLHTFRNTALRMIEVGRADLSDLNEIIAPIQSQPFWFIVYCDDLSFGAGEQAYRELKSVLDGAVAERPANLVVYATSNRRHLLPEYWSENSGESEIHANEAIAEKLALSDRFGLSLQVPPCSQELYLAMVRRHLTVLGIDPDSFDYVTPASRWALAKGVRNGRTARQFAIDYAGGISDLSRKG